jgi:hypothetical protein
MMHGQQNSKEGGSETNARPSFLKKIKISQFKH